MFYCHFCGSDASLSSVYNFTFVANEKKSFRKKQPQRNKSRNRRNILNTEIGVKLYIKK